MLSALRQQTGCTRTNKKRKSCFQIKVGGTGDICLLTTRMYTQIHTVIWFITVYVKASDFHHKLQIPILIREHAYCMITGTDPTQVGCRLWILATRALNKSVK